MKSNTLEFILKAKLIHGDKYDYSNVVYKHSKEKVLIKCNKCDLLFELTPNSHLQGLGCPKCGRNKARTNIMLNTSKFIEKAKRVHNNYYDYSKVNYIDSKTKVCIICPKHGEFWQIPANHLYGRGCSECSKQYQGPEKRSTEEFILEAQEIHQNKYDYSFANYLGAHKKIAIICPKHGIFYLQANVHLKGCGCPKCKRSKGELFVEEVLKQLQIPYLTQYKIGFKGLYMKADFFIELNNKNFIIEYNGLLHYKPIKYFGGELKFELLIKRDNILERYCLNNNIKLIKIKYDMKKDKIKEMLVNYLK